MLRYSVLTSFVVCCMAARADSPATVYQVQTVAGTGCPISGVPAQNAEIGTANGIAVDGSGNVYFSDTDNHLVRKINAAGVITTLAGNCTPGFSGDGGPATAAQLNQPYGVAVDSAGNVYVADYGNNRVRRIGTDGTITTIAGNGQGRLAGDGVAAVNAPLLTPRNVAADALGNLYISEFTGHRVRKLTPDGQIATFAGLGIAGYAGDSGPATSAQLNFPAGLTVDRSGNLYIADSSNHCVRKVSNGIINTVLGPGTIPSGDTIYGPVGVALDANGLIYIAEGSLGGASVGVYTPGSGKWSPTIIGPPGSNESFGDIAIDGVGAYLASGKQVLLMQGGITSGNPQTLLAGGSTGIGDGGSATAAQLSSPWGVALDVNGNLHIADTGNQRVRRVDSTGKITTEAGTGAAGFLGDNGPASKAELWSPFGIAADSAGNLYIADRNNQRIREVDTSGNIQTLIGTGQSGLGAEGLPGPQMPLNNPSGVCLDHSGTVYVVDLGNNRVLRALAGSGVTTVAGNGSPGYAGDGGPAPLAQLNGPTACILDAAGDLFIADTNNHCIREVTPDGNISTITGTGTAGFSGDGGPAAGAALNGPMGVAVDGNGDLFIADSGNSRIREITPDAVIQTIAGGPGTPSIGRPGGLTLDGSGNLYFAEPSANVIGKLAPGTATSSGGQSSGTPLPANPITAVNAFSFNAGPVAPGELLTIYGSGLGPQSGVTATPDAHTGSIPTSLGGAQVTFDGNAAPVLYAQSGQVNLQVPYSVAGAANTTVVVLYNGQPAGTVVLPVVPSAPAIFPSVANQDGSVNSQNAPAPANSIITVYATGEGLTTGTNTSGQPAAAPYPQPAAPVTLNIAGIPAQILFVGSAPGQVGTLQINARIPGGFIPSGQVNLVLTVGTASSPPISLWLQ
jgi:trimeric autotransporter adhesin